MFTKSMNKIVLATSLSVASLSVLAAPLTKEAAAIRGMEISVEAKTRDTLSLIHI